MDLELTGLAAFDAARADGAGLPVAGQAFPVTGGMVRAR